MAAGFAQFACCVATGLPILIVLPLFGGVDPRVGCVDLCRNLLNGICCGGLFGSRGDPCTKTGPGSERGRGAGIGLVRSAHVRTVDCSVGLSEDLAVDLCTQRMVAREFADELDPCRVGEV